MSNRPRSSDPEQGGAPGDRDRIDESFVAELASLTPRSGIDAGALHYEAGYQAALAESRGARRLYRGLLAAAAAAAFVALGWEFYVHQSLRTERDGLIAKLEEVTAPTETSIASNEQESASDVAPAVVEANPDDPAEPEASDVAARPPSLANGTFANDAFARQYLAGSSKRGRWSSMRWSDLYDLSPLTVTVAREPVSTTTPTEPAESGAAREPWSAFPSPRSLNALIEEGI